MDPHNAGNQAPASAGKDGNVKVVMVFHTEKISGLAGKSAEIVANPPLSVTGMEQALALVPHLKEEGPFAEVLYTSLLARALSTASVLALALGDMEIVTWRGLGQHASKDGEVVYYPGCEGETMLTWQSNGVETLLDIVDEAADWIGNEAILIVSHRPVIGGILAYARGITDLDGINAVVNDPALTKDGYIVLDVTDGVITFTG